MTNLSEHTIESVQIPEFAIEDIYEDIQSLNGGIKKKFTSQASTYTVVFKWDFGDGTIQNTSERSIIHEYRHTGTYTIRHQACLLDLECCYVNDIPWCVKTITVVYPKLDILPLLTFGGLFGLILIKKKECEDYPAKKECEENSCQWLEREKRCVKKCAEGYRLEKARIDGMKRPSKFVCEPIKKRSKSAKEK